MGAETKKERTGRFSIAGTKRRNKKQRNKKHPPVRENAYKRIKEDSLFSGG
jgi:hypothetical protein